MKTKNLKISFVEPHLKQYGGIRRIVEISNRLINRGYHVAIFHSDGRLCEWLKCNARTMPIKSVLDQEHDVLIFNDPNHLDFRLAKKAEAKLKFFYILGLYEKELLTTFSLKQFLPRSKYVRIRVLKKIFKSSSFVYIVNSTWQKKWIKKHLNINSELVLGGINTNIFYPAGTSKKSTNISILCSGDSRARRGTHVIKKALELAKKEHSSITLDTYSGKGIKQEDMARVYSTADIFIDASEWGGWSNPVAEAMACKTPVICTDIGAVQDFAFHDRTALLVPIGDAEAMSKAIIRLIRDKQLRKRLSDNAYIQIQKFEWESTVNKLEAIIGKYLNVR